MLTPPQSLNISKYINKIGVALIADDNYGLKISNDNCRVVDKRWGQKLLKCQTFCLGFSGFLISPAVKLLEILFDFFKKNISKTYKLTHEPRFTCVYSQCVYSVTEN